MDLTAESMKACSAKWLLPICKTPLRLIVSICKRWHMHHALIQVATYVLMSRRALHMHLQEQGSTRRIKQQPMSYLVPAKLAVGHDNVDQSIFEARRDLRCVHCSQVIAVGEHFTKQRSPRPGPKNRKEHPCCQRCYPFEEVVDTRPPVCF